MAKHVAQVGALRLLHHLFRELRRNEITPPSRPGTTVSGQSFTELCDPVTLDADGFLAAPDAPGIGIGLNDDAVKERLDPEFHML